MAVTQRCCHLAARLVRKFFSSVWDLLYFSTLQNSFSGGPAVLFFPEQFPSGWLGACRGAGVPQWTNGSSVDSIHRWWYLPSVPWSCCRSHFPYELCLSHIYKGFSNQANCPGPRMVGRRDEKPVGGHGSPLGEPCSLPSHPHVHPGGSGVGKGSGKLCLADMG